MPRPRPCARPAMSRFMGRRRLRACAGRAGGGPDASTLWWRPRVRRGVTTDHIDRLVFEFAMDHGSVPATLMYRGYGKSTCTSINHVVCHGIPNDKPLKEGDIVNVDVTLILDGWHGDSSRMYAVGDIPRRAERLIEVTYESMMSGIAAIRPA